MNNAVINIKTDPKVKKQAQKIAQDVGLSLSAVLNGYLRKFIKEKKVDFSTDETPNAYFRNVIRKAEKNIREEKGSPTFTNASDAIKWLEDQDI